jgi:predicted small secreted protein
MQEQTGKREAGMKKLLMTLVLLGAVLSVTSCNMLHGAGQDIQDAGGAIKDAAD